MTNLADLRKSYMKGSLSEEDVKLNPIDQFKIWFDQAQHAELPEPNAMTVASVDANGKPSARTVLIKEVTSAGFVFFTNYESRKGQALISNPHAALLFFWPELERQIRVEGSVEKLSDQESDDYFHSRPLDSRIGAWASPQSQVISGRTQLVKNAAEYALKFALNPPRPPHWGGFRVKPEVLEFWQGRPSRLHDRIQYVLQNGQWKIQRLAP
ncbi:pyridoxamine 5'-phosphate oxidase [Polynucleobacter sp. 30F-ANTBAC]|jgi:pyridoxamine 5'-phosphate oxidase|uniref:pyridoxamine 5'-phosphate oxidase n=1 Tax=Polynucleobacter sp. 30F-ANTBAC TaxID=2689095 RepID=UPI001C0E8018|nr:pyridoxamine 5'-phosphate oxidase [Polynucleobacter sp. 30F-ANTBAC]MBU3599505.1 pyridoxamine 5'-phosphate oxidase [Polynucleobacter sp. 30F-ANTBAC]